MLIQIIIVLIKILVSINKARSQTNEFSEDEAKKVLDKVLKALKTSKDTEFTVEAVQDEVEKSLMANKHFNTARAYIKYRDQQKELREIKIKRRGG